MEDNNIKVGIKFKYLIPFLTKEMKALLLEGDNITKYFILSPSACDKFKRDIVEDFTKQSQSWFNKLCLKWYHKTLKL